MWKVTAILTTSVKKGSFTVILILLADSFLFLFMLTKPYPKSVSFWFWLYDWNNIRNFELWMNFIPGRLAPQHYFQQLQNTLHTTFFSAAVRDGWNKSNLWKFCFPQTSINLERYLSIATPVVFRLIQEAFYRTKGPKLAEELTPLTGLHYTWKTIKLFIFVFTLHI